MGIWIEQSCLISCWTAIRVHKILRNFCLTYFISDSTLYDLTNTYFEGTGLYNDLAFHGHSKEKRSDCPLVTLGLVLDGSGFPKRSEIFKGNVNEASTLSTMIQGLEDNTLFEKPTIVMDAGIATQDNIEWLKDRQYPYIVVSRKRHREFDEDQSYIVKKDGNCTVRAQKVIDSDTGETLLYCHSTRKEEKEAATALPMDSLMKP